MAIYFLALIEILTLDLPKAIVHEPYAPPPLAVSGGGRCPQNNMRTRVVSGDLPPGLHLSLAGYLRGVPTRTGAYTFAVRAGNDCASTTRAYTLQVDGAPLFQLSIDKLEFAMSKDGAPPEPQTFLVASNWEDLVYDIVVDRAPWLTVTPARGRTPWLGSPHTGDLVRVAVDPEKAAKLEPGVYRAALRISAWRAAHQVSAPVMLTVHKW